VCAILKFRLLYRMHPASQPSSTSFFANSNSYFKISEMQRNYAAAYVGDIWCKYISFKDRLHIVFETHMLMQLLSHYNRCGVIYLLRITCPRPVNSNAYRLLTEDAGLTLSKKQYMLAYSRYRFTFHSMQVKH
jgi:hypothetical protein